ncbi:MAG: hypothetical protein U0807_03365 [Candidatus Binatia bacterium]
MRRRVIGLVVADSGGSPLAALGSPDLLALTPFAGQYRLVDFALAALHNAGVRDTYVLAPGPSVPALRAYLEDRPSTARPSRRRIVIPVPGPLPCGRVARLAQVLAAGHHLLRVLRADTMVALSADHLLALDVAHILATHQHLGAAVTLVGLPMGATAAAGRLGLETNARGRLTATRRVPASTPPAVVTTWTGEAVVAAAALPALLAAATRPGESAALAALARRCDVAVYDAGENRIPGTTARGLYWYEPRGLDGYYGAQMDLCTGRPGLDLYNPEWPVRAPTGALPPAKVMTDRAGRAGQALDSLVSDGTVICGGTVARSIVGRGVVVDGGAEVEDSILLDGCRIGPGARIRRAVVGCGVQVGGDETIGYDTPPAAPARVLRSGLTLVPPSLAAVRHVG